MTGIERLRRLDRENEELRDMLNQVAWHLGLGDEVHYYSGDNYAACQSRVLDAIDGLTKRESDVETVRSDAMRAWEWVREHGGLDHVKAEWSSRVPCDLYERRRQRLLDHIAECETALGRRNHRIEELGRTIEFFQLNNSNFRHLLADVAERLGFTRYGDDYEPEDLLDALDRRLMPEGCIWPRFDDGEPVRFGEEAIGFVRKPSFVVDHVTIFAGGEATVCAEADHDSWKVENFVRVFPGERVRRPAKVLDADGVEIRVGDTVYHVKDGSEMTVNGIEGEWLVVSVGGRVRHDVVTHRAPVPAADGVPLEVGQTVWDTNGDELVIGALEDGGHTVTCRYADVGDSIPVHGMWSPSDLTHQRPVLGADGVPINVGDTVYEVEGTGHAYKVVGIRVGDGDPLTPTVVTCDEGDGTSEHFLPSQLTHERPEIDSWERIEEDKDLNPFDYCKKVGHKLWTFDNAEEFKASDLVRRCRALAKRERGE